MAPNDGCTMRSAFSELVASTLLVVGALFPIVNPLGNAPIFLMLTRGGRKESGGSVGTDGGKRGALRRFADNSAKWICSNRGLRSRCTQVFDRVVRRRHE